MTANIGFWYDGGAVDYYVISSYGTFGPYTITSGLPAFAPAFSVMDFGAQGNAKDSWNPLAADTDDTAAFQAAVNNACAGQNHLVTMPELRFRLTIPANGAAIQIPNGCNNLQVQSPTGIGLDQASVNYFGAKLIIHGGPGSVFQMNLPKYAAIVSITRASSGLVTAVLGPMLPAQGTFFANRYVDVTGAGGFNGHFSTMTATGNPLTGQTLTWIQAGSAASGSAGTVTASPDASDYDGTAGLYIAGLSAECALDVSQNLQPLAGGGNYCAGITFVTDNRGGNVHMRDVAAMYFDNVFYGVQSDNDDFENPWMLHNHRIWYFGPHSESTSVISGRSDLNDNVATFDSAEKIAFYNYKTVNDGSSSTDAFELLGDYTDTGQATGHINFYDLWVENYNITGPDGYIHIGRNAVLQPTDVNVYNPLIDQGSQTTTPVVTAPGSGYTAVTCTVSNGATCGGQALNGQVVSVSIGTSTNNGSTPTISITGNGTGATATTTLSTTRTPNLFTIDNGDQVTAWDPKFKGTKCTLDGWFHFTSSTFVTKAVVHQGDVACPNLFNNTGGHAQYPLLKSDGDQNGPGEIFDNGQDATGFFQRYKCGKTSNQTCDIINAYDYTGNTTYWELMSTTTGAYQVFDKVNNLNRLTISNTATNASSLLNSVGTGSVQLNETVGSGTGGLVVGDGNGNTQLTVSNTGQIDMSLGTGGLRIKDQGSCTMSAGTCSAQSLGHTYSAAPACIITWTGTGTLTGILKAPSTTTTVTPASTVNTDTAVVAWACFGK